MNGESDGSVLGLTTAEAARRLREFGRNSLPEAAPAPFLKRFIRQFASPLIYILLFALIFDVATWLHRGEGGAPVDALVIGLILLLNAALGVVQEYRSEQALARLRELATPHTWALRDGRFISVTSDEIVPGDFLRLEAGERVPADGTLVEAHGLMLDESVVTGESLPVDKNAGAALLSGTLVVRGRALLEVTRTGAQSSMGKLATLVGSVEAGKTPLERRLDVFGQRIAVWVLALAVALISAGALAEGFDQLGHVLMFAVALAVSAVPEGLPAVVTLTLALGVQRMGRRKAVVRRLQAVETLGSVTVIATDKTGTLTENRMAVQQLEAADTREALTAMTIASDAELDVDAGDPLERALLEYARGQGVDPTAERKRHTRVAERPFDSAWKFMRVTVDRDGERVSYLKGASEVILERSRLSSEERTLWAKRSETLASEGYRVLALASGEGEVEQDLVFLGLVALWDPPRAEVPDAIRAAQAAGVRIVMITGDHPATALAVAQKLGIAGASGALTGADLDALTPDQLKAVARQTSIFARVSPENKLAIVEALKADGQIVAVTGDGVNDAPALKRSDVGVAMGQRGSDVAREVADLVLLDDNFASIVAAIEEGRGIYANIQKFVRFLFSTNAAEVLLLVAGTVGAYAMGLRDSSGALLLPLTAVQILWVNLITDGPPALALGVDRNADTMRDAPRAPEAPLLDPLALRFVLITAVLKAAVAGALLLGLPPMGTSLEATRTAVFLYTAVAQLAFAYPARRLGTKPLTNATLHMAIVLGVAVQLATVLLPGLRHALGLVPLDISVWTLTAVAITLTWALAEGTTLVLNRFNARGRPAPAILPTNVQPRG